jgi:adenylate cyclase
MTGWSLTFKGLGRLLQSGWGRRAAGITLILFLGLQLGAGWIFQSPQLALFDSYQRHFPRKFLHDGVVIVAIDDDSLKAQGQWPWPRHVMADLIARILAGKPAALGVDIFWLEPDRASPEQWLRSAGDLDPALKDKLLQLPRADDHLAEVLKSGPVVLGVSGVEKDPANPNAEPIKPDDGPLALFRNFDLQTPQDPAEPPDVLPKFDGASRSLPELDRAASGHGMASVQRDDDTNDIFRRLPMASRISGRLAPAMELEMLRVATDTRFPSIYYDHHAIIGVEAGEFAVPTQSDGRVWVNFSTHDPSRFVSAHKLLKQNNPLSPKIFENKFVLLGMTGLGQLDERNTPLGIMPGVEIHAQMLEDILLNRFASRPGWTFAAEAALTALGGLLLIILLPMLRARWQFLVGVAVLAALGALGAGLWWKYRTLLDVATPMIGQAAVMTALLGAGYAQADAQRRRLRLAAAKTAGELEAAHRIQAGILPSPASMAGDARFDLDALMIPARHIGGDFFDFFKLDDDHLYFAVGDVSGKGMPAALFMALGKSLCKSCALREENHIGAIINRANREISRDNTETLFITLFAGILNLATGELRFCNAGHDAPFVLRKGEAPHSLEAQGGPPLCIVEDFDYPEERFRLQPGDMLCVITDGITEAMTASGEVMGRARAGAVLADLPAQAGAAAAAKALHDAADRFVADAEPSDDLTILAVRWLGPTGR